MYKFLARMFILFVLVVCFVAPHVSAEVWTPLGRGIPPETRNIIKESRGVIDQSDFATYIDDFYRLNTSNLDTTSVRGLGGAVAAIVDSGDAPGILKISLRAIKGSAMNIKTVNSGWRLNGAARADSATVQLEYAVRFKTTDVSQMGIIGGFHINGTNGTDTGDKITFVTHDESAILYGLEQKTSVGTADSLSLGTLVDDTWYNLRLCWNGSSVAWYVNDVYKGRTSTSANQPRGINLRPLFEVTAGDSSTQYTYLDYLFARQRR